MVLSTLQPPLRVVNYYTYKVPLEGFRGNNKPVETIILVCNLTYHETFADKQLEQCR